MRAYGASCAVAAPGRGSVFFGMADGFNDAGFAPAVRRRILRSDSRDGVRKNGATSDMPFRPAVAGFSPLAVSDCRFRDERTGASARFARRRRACRHVCCCFARRESVCGSPFRTVARGMFLGREKRPDPKRFPRRSASGPVPGRMVSLGLRIAATGKRQRKRPRRIPAYSKLSENSSI